MNNILNKKVETIYRKLLEINALRNQISYLSSQTGQQQEIVKNSSLLWLARTTAIRLIVIDFCKLLNCKEANNIRSLIGQLNSSYRAIEWKNPISREDLIQIETRINNIVYSDNFKSIKTARDKYIAHDDPRKSKYNSRINIENLYELISGVETEFNIISHHLFNCTYHFPGIVDRKEIEGLHNYHRIRNIVAANLDRESHAKGFKAIRKIIIPKMDLE